MTNSRYVNALEDVYCHNRSAVTSAGLSCGSASLPTRIINGGKRVLYTAAMTGMLLNNMAPQAWADLTVSAGQTSTGLTVGYDYDYDVVSNYGTTISTIIYEGGIEEVYSGGVASNTTVNTHGKQYIYSGGVASNTTVNTQHGEQYIYSGGVASNTTLNGGSQGVFSGGVASSTTVNSGGHQTVSSGGVATDTTVNSGGWQYVNNGGIAIDTIVNDGGKQNIRNSGTASNTHILSGGSQIVSSGGTVISTLLDDYVIQDIKSGAIVSNNIRNTSDYVAGQNDVTSGQTSQYIINNNGVVNVSNGGIVTDNIIYSGGTENVLASGTANSTTVNADGIQNVLGTANDAIINENGTQNVSSGGIANDTNVNAGGTQVILASGIANDTTVNANGTQNVSGGTANNTVNNGTVNLYADGVLNDYSGNGNLNVYAANTLVGTTDLGSGKMLFANAAPTTVAVDNLSANNAVISMGVNLEDQTSDQLQINSSYNGTAKLSLRNTATVAEETTPTGIKLVDIDDNATVTGTFELLGNQWDEGAYIYKLYQDSGDPDYYLRSTGEYSDTMKTMNNVPSLNIAMGKAGMNSLNKRMGALRDMNNTDNRQGVWARTYYKDVTVDEMIKTDMSLFGVEAGYDWLFRANEPTKFYAGVMVGYMKTDSIKTKNADGSNNTGEGDAPSVGIYATLANENGWFIDLAARNFWNKIENKTVTASNNILKFDSKRNLITTSIEVGKTIEVDNGFKVEPKVEVAYMNAGSDSMEVVGGLGNLEYDAENYLNGRAAVMFSYKAEMGNKMLIEPLIELAYNREFAGKGKTRYAGTETETSLKGGNVEVEAGLSMQLSKDLYWHALGTYEKGSKLSGWGLNAGIRLGFGGK